MPRNLSLLAIHSALVQGCLPQERREGESNNIAATDASQDIAAHNQYRTLQAVTQGTDTSLFHEALHEYSLFARPVSFGDLSKLAGLVSKLVQLCGTSTDAWKVFCLTVCLRRYHEKAPEARHVTTSRREGDDDSGSPLVGDGERLIFYVTLLALQQCWMTHKEKRIGDDDDDENDAPAQADPQEEATKKTSVLQNENEEEEKTARHAYKAAVTMIRLAARIGGTRDLCAIIEHLTTANLLQGQYITIDAEEETPETFADKLVPAVLDRAIHGEPGDALLELALKLAAQQIDTDLRLVAESENNDAVTSENEDDKDILSTIHVMLPHSGRGSNTKGAWKRKLVNALAEILIWQRTEVATKDSRFTKAIDKLQLLPATAVGQVYPLVQQLQTAVRKKRQLLNGNARQQGFLLTSAYLIDHASLNLRRVRRAKAGDLKMLERIARKHRDVRVLKLIAKRHLDPSKATAITSIPELANDWIDTEKSCGDDDDEIARLELALQANTVQATLDKIRSDSERTAWVTCLRHDRDNLLCAILVAASLKKGRLYLGGAGHDVSTTEKCIALLNQVILHDKLRTEPPVTAEDMLTQKVGPSEDVLVVSARDLELDESILQDMQKRDVTIRVHATKRVESVGKVSLSLNDTIYDRIKAGQFLSLGVMLDCTGSMGSEIEGCKKGAIKLISNFRDLAPVKSFNFMGYWDPINVRTDPQPKSTGYLEANKDNMAVLQKFVDTELLCQGGGDEPEDIPKALEVFLMDMKSAGLSANEGVHFLFFIADAGFRANETTRVQAALEALRKLGIVLVMCRVRGGENLETFASKASQCFQDVGQYVELNGVGQLGAIAASVTESIRASLFGSDVKSVTASVGSTLDVLRQLTRFQQDNKTLKETEDLTVMSDDNEEEDKEMAKVEEDGVEKEDEELAEAEAAPKKREPKVFAEKKELTLSSRDRLYLQLSRLPPLCHDSVGAAFGGKALQEMAAVLVADRLRADKIPLSEVRKAGYPDDIVDLVKNLMGGSGVKRVVS